MGKWVMNRTEIKSKPPLQLNDLNLIRHTKIMNEITVLREETNNLEKENKC